MKGYWQDPDATLAVVNAGGWMHTGDLGVMDDDGRPTSPTTPVNVRQPCRAIM